MLVVGNGLVLTMDRENRVLPGGAVAIEGATIASVGDTAAIRAAYRGAEFLDARGAVIMPGLVNLHTHCYSAFARGLSLAGPPPETFGQVLERLWWRLDRELTAEDVRVSGLLGFADSLRAGVTTVFDHHSSPNAIDGSLDLLATAASTVGVRACLCYEVSDRDGADRAAAGIRENARFLRERAPAVRAGTATAASAGASAVSAGASAAGCMGLHASFTLSDDTIARAVAAAKELGAGCHIHAAEGPEDAADCRARHGKSVIRRLADLGVLGPRSIAAHCVHVDAEDIAILASTGTTVAHNPQSNMNNAVGIAPVLEMAAGGVSVGLGTDGFSSDMLESASAALVLRRLASRNPSAAWPEVREMTLTAGARVASRFFGLPLGVLAQGAAADLIVVEYDPPTPLNARNYWGHLLFGVRGPQVRDVVVAGKVALRERRLTGLDEADLRARARELAAALWRRLDGGGR